MFFHKTNYAFSRYGKKKRYILKKKKSIEFITDKIYNLTFPTLRIITYNTLISY